MSLRALLALALVGLLAACAQQNTSNLNQDTEAPLAGSFIWHDLITDDVAAAKAFYGPLFGWRFERRELAGGKPYTLIISGDRYVGGMVELADPDTGEDYSRWIGYYAVDDLDAATAATVAAGGMVAVAPRELGDFARAAAVHDPEGAVVGLIESQLAYRPRSWEDSKGQIVWNELVAADAASAGNFYLSLTGGTVAEEQRARGVYRTLQHQGQAQAGIMQRPADELTPLWLSYFAVRDAGLAAQAAADSGATVLLAPTADVREGTIAVITDPSGAILALQSMNQGASS
ncbi:MAG: VOC family protein [Xanthomonadales bacterium]|nr:VOC family protein [Xanthomonadales bacterium]